jgi:alkyl sulfatase BDS1-like metallo-beta-lactamase superfamily hydrolase
MSRYWKDVTELTEAFTELFNRFMANPELSEKAGKLNQVVAFRYRDPDVQFWWDLREGHKEFGTGDPPAEFRVRLSLSGDDGHRSWSNKLNPVMAITRKKIQVEGNATGLLKLQPLLKKSAVIYDRVLDDLGMSEKKLRA